MDNLNALSALADFSLTIFVLGALFLYRIWGVGELIRQKTEELEHRNRRLRAETAEAASGHKSSVIFRRPTLWCGRLFSPHSGYGVGAGSSNTLLRSVWIKSLPINRSGHR